MIKMRLFKGFGAMLIAGAMFIAPANALTITITSGASSTSLFDGVGLGGDGLLDGIVSFSGVTVGGATVSVSAAVQSETANSSTLSLSVLSAVASATNLLFIDVSHVGFGAAAATPESTSLGFTMNASNISGGTLGGQAFVDNANGEFATTDAIGVADVILASTDTISEIDTAVVSNPFSLTILTTLVNGASANFDAILVAAVPIPPALLLFGTPIFGLALSSLRRRRKNKNGLKAVTA